MRVLIVQKRFHPNSIGLVKALKAHGHEVRMIVYVKSSGNLTEDHTVIDPVHVPYYKFFLWFWKQIPGRGRHKFSVPRLGQILQELRDFRPDLVILKTYRVPSLITGAMAGLLGFKKVLLTNISPLNEASWKNNLLKALGFKHRICTTVETPDALENGWVRGARFLPYPIGVSCESNGRKSKNESIKLLCVGSLESLGKRPWWVVEAVHRADLGKIVEMTFAGLGTPESEGARRIFALADAYELQDRVRIIYNTPHEKMNSVYSQHDLLVHPSRRETFCAVILEAMACGLPVICGDKVGAKACFVHGEEGMVFPARSVDAMASCLKQMCRDPENISLMGRKAKQKVENEYSGSAFVKHLESLIA